MTYILIIIGVVSILGMLALCCRPERDFRQQVDEMDDRDSLKDYRL